MTFAVVSIATLLIFMGSMTWFLTRQILLLPQQAVVARANAIALGDLTHRLDRQHIGQDELGMLASASLKMQWTTCVGSSRMGRRRDPAGAAIEEVSAVLRSNHPRDPEPAAGDGPGRHRHGPGCDDGTRMWRQHRGIPPGSASSHPMPWPVAAVGMRGPWMPSPGGR